MAVLLFAIVVIVWGLNWPVTKIVVEGIPPLWATALRFGIAGVILLVLQLAQGSLIVPRQGDVPIVFGIAILHMILFSGLISIGLQFVPASRAIVLGYTTPLWVIPGAVLFLGEPLTRWRVLGVGLGIVGLIVMFNPLAFAWSDPRADRQRLHHVGRAVLGDQHPAGARPPLGIDALPAGVLGSAAGNRGADCPRLRPRGRAEVTWTMPCCWRCCTAGARNGGGLLGDGHGQSQPARHDHIARPAGDAGGRDGRCLDPALEPITLTLICAMALIIGGIAIGTLIEAKSR